MKDTRLFEIFSETKQILCKYDYSIHTPKKILHLTNSELKLPHLMGLQYIGRKDLYTGDNSAYSIKKGKLTMSSMEKFVRKFPVSFAPFANSSALLFELLLLLKLVEIINTFCSFFILLYFANENVAVISPFPKRLSKSLADTLSIFPSLV